VSLNNIKSQPNHHKPKLITDPTIKRTEMDVMATTPRRIADLFCPEISMSELNNIRQRIHATVVMGMGTNSSAHAASLEDEEKEIPVAKRVGRSEVEQVC
jgi:hypothetical protein